MKGKEIIRQILLAPAMAALIAVMFLGLLHWSFTRESYWRAYGDRGEVYETWETSNGKFKVKVDARHETGVFMGGAYYIFHSAPIGSEQWREFVWHRVDDPHPISQDMFRFVSDDVGYVSMSQAFAVTTDQGQNWSVWKPTEELKDWDYSFPTIKEVSIETDGRGRIILAPFHGKQIEVPELHTTNYGRHWNVVHLTTKPNKSLKATP